MLINHQLAALAGSTSIALGNDMPPATAYRFELIMAGYDEDGSARLGGFSLTATARASEGINYYDVVVEQEYIVPVGTQLKVVLGGQTSIAFNILNSLVPSHDHAIERFQNAMAFDHGASLSIEEMKEIGITLSRRTAMVSPSVGGEDQVAILRLGSPIQLTQRSFPKPARDVLPFSLLTNVACIGFSSCFLSRTPVVVIAGRFERTEQSIDGNYFVGTIFRNSTLVYGGGQLLGFDRSNKVVGSRLVLRGVADPNSPMVRDLAKNFTWSEILYVPFWFDWCSGGPLAFSQFRLHRGTLL